MAPLLPTPLPPGLDSSFEVVRLLGTGGMGVVWLVRDRFLDRLVALKVLLAEHSNSERRERFLREARTSARLEHPHIIDVYRADETQGIVWFTMRFIDGQSLGERIRDRGALPVSEAVRILREVAWGLAYAHARGVVHRDVKPDNILLDRESGRAVVTDFGIARDLVQDVTNLTIEGHVLGSAHFMSPEQASDETLDGRSDIYALGCVGYLMLCGRVPFDGSLQNVLVAQVTRPAPPLHSINPQLPASVCAVIEQCMRKDAHERFATADALATALEGPLREAVSLEQASADAAHGGVLSEEKALAVWQRAAQLQADAAHRMERAPNLQPAPTSDTDATPSSSYRVRDVEAAAIEAGISRQYVALALAEQQLPGATGTPILNSERNERQFTTMLGTADRAISVSRVIPATPKSTLSAIGVVFTSDPYRLRVNDTVNGHPLDGGILRFASPRLRNMTNVVQTKRLIYRLEQIALFDLNVTLQARGSAERPACEVVITGDLRKGLEGNLRTQWGFIGVGSALAGAGALGLSAALGSAALAAVPGVGVAVLTAGGALAGYRWLYRKALREAIIELNDLLVAVERHLTQQQLFNFDAPPPR
ncbi:MAG: serine/threonine-protein kinase [Gemmatimonas sp.]